MRATSQLRGAVVCILKMKQLASRRVLRNLKSGARKEIIRLDQTNVGKGASSGEGSVSIVKLSNSSRELMLRNACASYHRYPGRLSSGRVVRCTHIRDFDPLAAGGELRKTKAKSLESFFSVRNTR